MDKIDTNKEAMLEALEASLGIVSTAAKKANVGRSTHYKWIQEDAEYKSAVEEIQEGVLDFAESHLYKLIKDGNPAANIFYLKTKGRKRGYVEHQELTLHERPALSWLDEAGS
jgi:hypothetical protein